MNTTDDSRDGIEKYLKRNPSTSFVAEDGGNAFWESIGFTAREDLFYRNKNIHTLKPIE